MVTAGMERPLGVPASSPDLPEMIAVFRMNKHVKKFGYVQCFARRRGGRMNEQPKRTPGQVVLALAVEGFKFVNEMAKEEAKKRIEQDRRDAKLAADYKRLRKQGKI
jgi:hypothetical protein